MSELALWHLDQKVNDRGICIDVDFVRAAIETAEREKDRLAGVVQTLTDGEVKSALKRDKLLKHILEHYGVSLPDMRASTIELRVNDYSLPLPLRQLLDARLQASMGSTGKYRALLRALNDDGRVRGLIQFSGAPRTRRAAGRTFQPQNLMRPPKWLTKQWETAIEAIKRGHASEMYDNVMEVVAGTVRGAIVASPGKKLVVSDLSNIEGRGLAEIAGEEWKLQAFRDYDAGIGFDLYKLAYSKSFGVAPDNVDDEQRSCGKILELSMGYAGGVGALVTFSLAYGVDLDEMAERAAPTIPSGALAEATDFYEWMRKQRRSTLGLERKTYIVLDAQKRLWRGAHPKTVELWKALEQNVRHAIAHPGHTFTCGKLLVRRDGAWLRIKMPSSNYLCYPSPEVSDDGQISYMGQNQYTRKWSRVKSYGGKFTENIIQSFCRDIFYANKLRIEDAGYEIVLEVHDELVTETLDTSAYGPAQLSQLMSTNPAYCPDMPLAAAGWEGYRYRKG